MVFQYGRARFQGFTTNPPPVLFIYGANNVQSESDSVIGGACFSGGIWFIGRNSCAKRGAHNRAVGARRRDIARPMRRRSLWRARCIYIQPA